jgi:prophage DNA circulation protein
VEDNGLKVADFHIKAVVHGVDALGRLRALEAALNTPGPGTLIHPIWGRQFVQVMGPYKANHTDDKIGVFELEITFAVTGPAQFPGFITGIAAAITNLSASAISDLFAAFVGSVTLPVSPASINAIAGAVGSIGGSMVASFGAVASVQSIGSQLMSTPAAYLNSASHLADAVQALVRAPFEAPKDVVSNASLYSGFADLHAVSREIIDQGLTVVTTTLDRAQRADALVTLGTTLQAVSVMTMCEAAAGKVYQTAESVTEDITALTDNHGLFMSLPSSVMPELRIAVGEVVNETTAVLMRAQVTLPNVVSMRVPGMPPSILCYTLYETDADQMIIIGLNEKQSPVFFDGEANVLHA